MREIDEMRECLNRAERNLTRARFVLTHPTAASSTLQSVVQRYGDALTAADVAQAIDDTMQQIGFWRG